MHRGLGITEEPRLRFVSLYMKALAESDLPEDAPFRETVASHVEFGTRVAMQNSNARSDDELHPLREEPHWTWPGDESNEGSA